MKAESKATIKTYEGELKSIEQRVRKEVSGHYQREIDRMIS